MMSKRKEMHPGEIQEETGGDARLNFQNNPIPGLYKHPTNVGVALKDLCL